MERKGERQELTASAVALPMESLPCAAGPCLWVPVIALAMGHIPSPGQGAPSWQIVESWHGLG